jgi:hypothetical protein
MWTKPVISTYEVSPWLKKCNDSDGLFVEDDCAGLSAAVGLPSRGEGSMQNDTNTLGSFPGAQMPCRVVSCRVSAGGIAAAAHTAVGTKPGEARVKRHR